jgi:hypothetical protein
MAMGLFDTGFRIGRGDHLTRWDKPGMFAGGKKSSGKK